MEINVDWKLLQTLLSKLQVILKEGSIPFMAKSSRYPPLHKDCIDSNIADLMEHDLIYRNPDFDVKVPRVL